MRMDIRPFDAALGAEIRGVNLAEPLDDDTLRAIEDAWNEYSLLLFRGQSISAEQHVAFSRRFGELEIHVLDQWRHRDFPELLIVSNIRKDGQPVGVYNAGRYWHTDLSYMQAPSRGSILYAIEVPEDNGKVLGDTVFASATAAYAALPDDTKRKIEGLTAQFSLAYQRSRLNADGDTEAKLTPEQLAKTPVATHRLVQTHPVTGEKLLFANEGHAFAINELPKAQGAALLQALCDHCTQPRFCYRHSWRVGDVLMWDNIPTQHLAIFDYALPQRRYMHRTTLLGVELS